MVEEEEKKIVGNDGDILSAKWDACIDSSLRRVFYTSVAGAVSSVLLFRGPASRWAALAFGAGVGIGSAYTESSRILEGSLPNWTSKRQKGVKSFYLALFTPVGRTLDSSPSVRGEQLWGDDFGGRGKLFIG